MATRKKKRTLAQIAATKKLVALNKKKRAKKKTAKKKTGRKKTAKKKTAKKKTGRKLTEAQKKKKRKVKRKKLNTVKGYYPNPVQTQYFIVYGANSKNRSYFDGAKFTRSRGKAAHYTNKDVAKKIGQKIADTTGSVIGIFVLKKKR